MRFSPILRMANIKALVTRTKKIPAIVESISVEELPKESKVKQSPGICDTIVKVKYSTLNYKDALVSIIILKMSELLNINNNVSGCHGCLSWIKTSDDFWNRSCWYC